MKIKEVTRLLAVLIVGFVFGSGLSPLHAEDPVAKGEILNVCINKKSGALRVASKCTTAERKTVLGGVGARGEKGDKGDIGATGLMGETGAVGPQGVQGPAGTNGVNGAQGERGLTGATGATGAQGVQGERGLTGVAGPQGERGQVGLTGAQGPQGFTGATGSVASLRTRSITVWEQSFGSFCSSFFGFSALNANTSLSTFGNSISLNKSCSTLTSSNVTVYAP
jgi:hypothetical protein